jgi:hypothetical protein
VRDAFTDWQSYTTFELDVINAARTKLATAFSDWLEWIEKAMWRENVIDRVGRATWERQRLLSSRFRMWNEFCSVERRNRGLLASFVELSRLDAMAFALSRWTCWSRDHAELNKLLTRTMSKLADRRVRAAFRGWSDSAKLSKSQAAADAWSKRQILVSAFVVWHDRVRDKLLAGVVKDAEGERVALVEAEAMAQIELQDREQTIGLLESQLAQRSDLLQQQHAETQSLRSDLEGARARARLLEIQLADADTQLQAASVERQAVQGAVSERAQQVEKLGDGVSHEITRLTAENDGLAEQLALHVNAAQELAVKVDAIEQALVDEQATHARLQLQYETQLREATRDAARTALHVASADSRLSPSRTTTATLISSSPEVESEQFLSPELEPTSSSPRSQGKRVDFRKLPQQRGAQPGATHGSPRRLTLSPIRASSARSERTDRDVQI